MHTYTNVLFDGFERQTLDVVGRHLSVAYPAVHTDMPRKQQDRSPDHEARVVLQLVRDATQGTHENVTRAAAVVTHLVEVLTRESDLDYWLDDAEKAAGARPPFSAEPTSTYQVLRMLSEVRADQLRDASRALSLLMRATQITSPRTPDSVETSEYDEATTA